MLLPVRCLVRRADAAGRSGARGPRLGALLDAGPRRLLVLDDVWEAGQLAPFADGGRRCARLVTTRVPGLLAGRGVPVLVDQMSAQQARELLTSGLPLLDPALVEGLLAVTGRWPLLLRLVSKIRLMPRRPGNDGTARIWDAVTGRERAILTGHTGGVYAVVIAPDGSWLATAGNDDGTARIWDAVTGKERAILTGHTGGVYAVAIAPDGSWLATGSNDGTARIWDAVTDRNEPPQPHRRGGGCGDRAG